MGYNLVISPEAQTDFDLSYEYYLEISWVIANKFKQELFDYLEKIQTNPLLEIRYLDFRFMPMNRFPFVIIYTVDLDEKLVEIRAIFHTSRDPYDYPNV